MMLYPKNGTEKLDQKLFRNPTSEYRAAPFWAWNCELNADLLKKEIDYLTALWSILFIGLLVGFVINSIRDWRNRQCLKNNKDNF